MAAARTDSRLGPLLPVYTVIFVGFVGYSLMITVFTPLILYAHAGVIPLDTPPARRPVLLGLLLSAYPLGQFFGSPVLGALSDRFGRKPILLVSLAVTTACYALLAAALTIGSFALLAATSLLAGLSEANVAIAQSAIADVTTADTRNRLFGYIYLSASLAYVVGPLAGGKLADPTLAPWFTYATPFWAVFGLLVATLPWTAIAFRETRTARRGEPVRYGVAFTNLLQVFTNRRLRRLYAVNFLVYLAIYGFFRCYPMYLVDEFRLDVSRVSEFIAWVAVPIVIANLWLTGFIGRRIAVPHVLIGSAVLTGLMMIGITIPPQLASLWVTLFLTGLALAVCLPAAAAMISISVSPEEQGRAMGNNQSLQVGAEALSGLIGGALAAVMMKLPLVVLGIVAIVAASVLGNTVDERESEDSAQGAIG
jgi:DHA1 family tetracycline resistance protein-like MFS transporter